MNNKPAPQRPPEKPSNWIGGQPDKPDFDIRGLIAKLIKRKRKCQD